MIFCFVFPFIYGGHSPSITNTNGENRKSVLPELLTVSSLVPALGRFSVQVPLQLAAWVLVRICLLPVLVFILFYFLLFFSLSVSLIWLFRVESSVTAPNIPLSSPRPRSQRWLYQVWYLFATTLSTSLQSLCYSVGKNRSKVPSRKVTMHCPAPRCDSLKVRPTATSERKRVYWQMKTGLRRVHILQNKKKIITPISAVDNKRVYKTSKLQMATKICGWDV